MDRPRPFVVTVGTGLAEVGNGDDDQARIAGQQGRTVEVQRLERAGLDRLDEDVADPEQVEQRPPVRRGLDIEG
jgi:hypothetical protein